MNLQFVSSLEEEWNPLINEVQCALDQMRDLLTVNVSGQLIEPCEPYVQVRLMQGNLLDLEAVSDWYLDQPLSMRAWVGLRYLDWNDPGSIEGNHSIILPPNRPGNHLIARFLILTLRDVYGATPSCSFDCFFE